MERALKLALAKSDGDLAGEPAGLELLRLQFRPALRQLAGGVSIVTAGAAPSRTGLTVTSVSSLSADPPSVIVSINRSASAYAEIARCGYFGVSILAAHHEPLAARFAGAGGLKGEARFAGECWHTLATGASLLCDALAVVDCALEELIERHSHAIAIGRVVATQTRGVGDALVYWRGDYHRLGQSNNELATAQWAPILRARRRGCG